MAKKKKGEAPFAAKDDAQALTKESEAYPGRVGPIGPDEVQAALNTFRLYKEGKANIEARAIANEEWYRQRYAEAKKDPDAGGSVPAESTAWLFNSISNKHADAMDNIPMANILPREESDQEAAETLSKIVPLIMEKADFESKYDDCWYDKLIAGGGIYKVFWNNSIDNGLGDIDIQNVDVLNVFWQPKIADIQDSENFFHVEYESNKMIEEAYPFMKNKLTSSGDHDIAEYRHDDNNTEQGNMSLVYDWYYKKRYGTKEVVHYCRFCNGEVLWASENTPEYDESGYYDHGMYPFVFDSLFRLKDSPYGFGYVDVMKNPQFYIDKLDTIILKNAQMAAKPRWFKKKSNPINVDQFANWENDFVDVDGSTIGDESFRQIVVNPLPNYILNHHVSKIEELKETSGNRDFSQGSTTSGVTAASAIAALQEAGSKLSRDMLKSSYRAYRKVVVLVVELIRQFYTEERYFRIEGPNGEVTFTAFDNRAIQPMTALDDMGQAVTVRQPVFDFKISSQKQSPFSRTAQNELAKELFALGIFNPAMADQASALLEIMDFEGIEAVRKRVAQNGLLYQQLLQMTQLAMQFAQTLDASTGGMAGAMQQVAMIAGQGNGGAGMINAPAGAIRSGGIDNQGLPVTDNTQAGKARVKAASAATPK